MEITTELLVNNAIALFKNVYFHILFWVIFLDVVSGIVKAFKGKKYNSTIGINGLLRHLLVLFAVIIAGTYARILGITTVFSGILLFFIGNYAVSIIENWDEIGLPLPAWLKIYFEKIIEEENNKNWTHKRKGDR